MNPGDFQMLSELVKKRSGLVLSDDKVYLVKSRLMPLVRNRGMNGLDELVGAIREGKDKTLPDEVTEAMTTNESFFFRDVRPFEQFRTFVLPKLLEANAATRKIRIWSAASSNGQEPYTVAMILKDEAAKLTGWRIEFLATDISKGVLEKAKAGVYSQFEVQRGLPVQHLIKYFKETGQGWEIAPSLRAMVEFKEFNLLNDMKSLGKFDIVFCRNVLIYFDQPTKTDVLNRISQQMTEHAVMYLGGAETVLGISDKFKPVPDQRGIYALVP
ncbi:MAG: protein-glutamate O-methyltransferase CheR [Proteobacteria bacterium]|nr:protein-glutamate O-methyltransferase CheR [Pseudomonadota bacterium]